MSPTDSGADSGYAGPGEAVGVPKNQHTAAGILTSASLKNYTGAEPFVVGLAPAFWAHVPLHIASIHNLKLINGLHCLLVSQNGTVSKILPITKVTLIGTIVCAERRSNGSVLYVIDDGTGLVDCLHWLDNPFTLPSLTDPESSKNALSVGTLIKVRGRIECIYIHTDKAENISVSGNTLESQRCIREIHANAVVEVTDKDDESLHWDACQSLLASSSNALGVLELLGSEIQAQVDDRMNLPSADDMCGEWRLFGTKCRCHLSYKDTLLYCHCQASTEPLDPEYRYRDRLLEILSSHEQAIEKEPLCIQYKNILNDIALQRFALEIVGEEGDTRRLVTSTIRCLRKDGILFHLCRDTDTYLLISVERVLKPYMQKIMSRDSGDAVERAELKKNRPDYLENVPKARLDLIRRQLLKEQQE